MGLTIASQWPEPANAALRADGLQVLGLPAGIPAAIPDEVSVLLLAPPLGWGGTTAPMPTGWPFKVRWVHLMTAGFDFYPPWLFDGPIVTTARGVTADAMAEFVLAAIFAASKQLPSLWVHDPAGWRPTPLRRIAGTTLGLFGFGAIGHALGRRALALDMKVVAVRQSSAPPEVAGVTLLPSIDELAAQSDHLVLAAPLNDSTRHIVNARLLAKARPGLHLINVARGGLVDQAALLAALDDDRVGLATLDVTEPEPLPGGHPFYSHPKVRLSPHTSPVTPDGYVRHIEKFRAALPHFEAGRELVDTVAPQAVR